MRSSHSLTSTLPILIHRLHLPLQCPDRSITLGLWLIIQAFTIPVMPYSLVLPIEIPQTFSLFPIALLHVWSKLKKEGTLRQQ